MPNALKALSDGAVTGSNGYTLTAGSNRFGGGRLIADGTNTGTVHVYDGTDDTGNDIFELSSKNSMTDYAPIYVPSGTIYVVVSGTGASFQPYEWLDAQFLNLKDIDS